MHNLYAIVVVCASIVIVGTLTFLLKWLERQQPFPRHLPFRRWILPLLLVLISFLDGTLRHEFRLPGPPGAVLGALNAFVIVRGFVRRTIWLSTLQAVAIWCAWALGWTAAHGGVDDNVLPGWFGVVALVCVATTCGLVAGAKAEMRKRAERAKENSGDEASD